MTLCSLIHTLSGDKTGVYFIDSTLLRACHIKREKQNNVFVSFARKSKSIMDFFFGFKFHIIINDKCDFMEFKTIRWNVDDREPIPYLAKELVSKLVRDNNGYIFNKHSLWIGGVEAKSFVGLPLLGE